MTVVINPNASKIEFGPFIGPSNDGRKPELSIPLYFLSKSGSKMGLCPSSHKVTIKNGAINNPTIKSALASEAL